MVAFAISGLLASAQGMDFTKGTLSEGLTAADKASKLVFVDVYTTWCGPCKHMTASIFPDSAVGKLMNGKFINMKFDAEAAGEGKSVATKYKIRSYPTMLILDAKGKELARLVGSSSKPEDFVVRINDELAKLKK